MLWKNSCIIPRRVSVQIVFLKLLKKIRLKRYLEAGRTEAGVDEAGRGCLAGPVYAAAVILPKNFKHPGLNDSKKLSRKVRDELRGIIEKEAICWSVGTASQQEIDSINILQASFLAMHRAIEGLKIKPAFLLIDGNRFRPYPEIPHKTVIGGDGLMLSIAAASILAKTWRDEYMENLHLKFPEYCWNKNMGYGTLKHREAIREFGVSEHHRHSFTLLPEEQLSLF